MFDQILIAVGALIILYASYTDWQTTEVPDWLTYSGIGFGIGARTSYAMYLSQWDILTTGLIGFGVFFVVGCLLYYTGQWGGGDAKLLMALGALLGLEFALDHNMVAFVFNLMLFGGIYGLVYTLVLAIKHKSKVKKQLSKLMKSKEMKTIKVCSYVGCLLFLLLAFFFTGLAKWMMIALAVIVFLSFYLLAFSKSVEDAALIKRVTPNQLMEGDWILDEVKHKGKTIVSPKDLGVTIEQITLLQELAAKGKVKKITMKQGIPFVPAFAIAYFVTLMVGNFFLFI